MLSIFNEIGKRAPWLAAVVVLVAILLAIFASPVVMASESTPLVKGQTSAQKKILNLKSARNRSTKQAEKECKRRQIFIEFGIVFRKCAGWFAGSCVRQSLSNPYYGTCYLTFFMEDAARGQLDCRMIQGWRSSPSGTTIRTKRGTTPWFCVWEDGSWG